MKTVAIVAQKGGPGKSTLAINLAVAAGRGKKKTLLLDLDPQETTTKWYQRRAADRPAVISIRAPKLAEALQRAKAAKIDLVVIDTAGRDDPSSATAIKHADFCLVACRPTPADMEALEPTIEALKRQGKPFAFVITQTPASGFRIVEAEKALGNHGTIAPVPIVYRVAYQDALGNGQGVVEYAQDHKATREIIALSHWLGRQLRQLK